MTPARYVIRLFGGLTPLSKALGHRNPTTVQGWWKRESIPPSRYEAILSVAAAKGIDLRPQDFVVVPDNAASRLGAGDIAAMGGAYALAPHLATEVAGESGT